MSGEPKCATCAKPAACAGAYEDPENPIEYACGVCCGHGNEDGFCFPVAELPARLTEVYRSEEALRDEHSAMKAELSRCVEALEVVASGHESQALVDAALASAKKTLGVSRG